MAVGFSFLWGTFGVLLGFALATLLTSYWIEPYVLYKHGFKKNIKEYLFIILKQTLLLIILFGTVFFITYSINIGGWFELLIKAIICFTVPNFLLFLIYRKTEEFKYFKNLTQNLFKSLKSKILKI